MDNLLITENDWLTQPIDQIDISFQKPIHYIQGEFQGTPTCAYSNCSETISNLLNDSESNGFVLQERGMVGRREDLDSLFRILRGLTSMEVEVAYLSK